MKLGTMLLRDGVIGLGQLEAALRTQVLYGGRLGTNLVELGFIDVDTLGEYLGRILEVPVATQELFEAVDQGVVDEFGSDLAELYGAFPLGFEDDDQTLALALIEPRAEASIAQLAKQCGHPIAPHAAGELRILYYIEKRYGLERKARYVRAGTRRAAPGYAEERRRAQPAGGIELPPVLRLEPRPKKGEAEQASSDAEATSPPDAADAGQTPHRESPAPKLSYRDACDRIDGAEHRNQIADALVDFAAGRFEVTIVFLLRDGNALGWRSHANGDSANQQLVEHLALPLGGSSALQAACDAAKPYRGPSPSPGRPVEKRLWEALGTEPEPDEVLVAPILVKQRVVNLVYAHGFAGAALDDASADELIELCLRASDAYVRLIREAKAAARSED